MQVVDLTHVLAGPYCTYQLSLLGASVTKVESPRGDMVRAWGGDPEQVSLGQNRDGSLLGRYAVKDGYVMLAGYRPSHQRSILKAIGLATYASLGTADLLAQMPEIETAVEQTLAQRSAAQWDEVFSRSGVVAGGVQGLVEVFESGQPEARELMSNVESAFGEHQVTTAGYRINDAVFTPGSHVPELGEHTKEVLADLGYTDAEIAGMVEQQIVGLPEFP
jgi:formyl-CoA transferase